MAGGPDPDPNSTVQASLKALQVENALLAAFQPAMETELQHARSENAMLKRDLAKASAGKDRNVRGTPSARPAMPQMPQSEPTVSLKLEPVEPLRLDAAPKERAPGAPERANAALNEALKGGASAAGNPPYNFRHKTILIPLGI